MASMPRPQLAALEARSDDRVFTLEEARQQGFTWETLRGSRLSRPFRGLRSLSANDATLYDRAVSYAARLRPDERFSHTTALALFGCPVRVPLHAPADVEIPVGFSQVRARGVRGHRRRRVEHPYCCAVPESLELLPTVQPLRAVLQAANELPFTELLVALDHLLLDDEHRYDPHLRIFAEDLSAFAERAAGPGCRRFRQAATLARQGAESRMETLSRMIGVRAGMPQLSLQHAVFDSRGRRIGRFDLADEETMQIFEYDGEHHRLVGKQFRKDLLRLDRARDEGWGVMVLHAEDVLISPERTGRRMPEKSSRRPLPVPVALTRPLDERWSAPNEPAIPIPSFSLSR